MCFKLPPKTALGGKGHFKLRKEENQQEGAAEMALSLRPWLDV